MRHSTQTLYAVRSTPEERSTPAESFGRITRSIASATPVLLAPARRSANESDIASPELCDACARRAQTSSGFGDAAIQGTDEGLAPACHDTHRPAPVVVPVGETPDAPSAMQLEAAARAERSRLLGDIAASVWRPVAQRLQHLLTQAKQRRQARATYLVLRDLDARTLHDIGIDRSEILSVALELGGAFQSTRVHSALATRGR
jgi:uncharacterized protein YjiS (DUF1127 family)